VDKFLKLISMTEPSREVREVRALSHDQNALGEYWDVLFRSHYDDFLEDSDLIGRNGVLAEFIDRFASGGKILDVGCGTGILANLINPLRYHYLGIDVSEVAIGIASQKQAHPNFEFRVATLDDLKNEDNFSAIVFNEVLYYLDAHKALTSSKRLLGRMGIVLISLFDFYDGRLLMEQLPEIINIHEHVQVHNVLKKLQWHILVGSVR
jgi:2-polyprenyl-3-methyl-5-hydroxy-6-metoxy-1,4-benzoquinol methylase